MKRDRRCLRWRIVAVALFALGGCVTAPYTHRSQFMIVSASQEMALGADAYKEVLSKAKLVQDPQIIDPVQAVGERIAKVANRPDYRWEFRVIDDAAQVNAFALPGGKVAVYTGLFPVAYDSAGLAAVLGHEVAHALARHSAERLSQALPLQVAGLGLSAYLGSYSPGTQQAIMQAFGLGAQIGVLLPFGRTQEAEADHIGLILMAEAGYDPHAALALWKRFEAKGGKAPPEFLSTHPSYGTRERNIASWLPEAMQYFKPDPTLEVRPLPAIAHADTGSGGPHGGAH
jgi:metalloendopeptidase OMA1, mitochondrial